MNNDNPMNGRPANPRFSGTGMDPTFVPQPQESTIPHDMINSVMGFNALEHPTDNGAPQASQPTAGAAQNDDPNAPKPMTDEDLLALVKSKIETSHQWYGSGKLSSKRIKADQYYRGEPRGDEQEGRSQVVSRDVAEAVDGAMPSMMRVFAGGEQVCAFDPNGPEDEEAAKQATDYVNHIFMQQNEGFMILYTWFKDSFLKKNGIVKAWFETRYTRTKENYEGLSQPELDTLKANSEIQVTNIQQVPDTVVQQDPNTGEPVQTPIMTYTCTAICMKPVKKICVMNVPPDEFIIERRAVSIYSANFLAHRGQRTINDLIELGYDRDKVMGIPGGDEDFSQERTERFRDEEGIPYTEDDNSDPTMRKVWVTEAYVKCDFDGDGYAEWRMVLLGSDTAGKSSLLANEEVDDHPFSDLTPDPEPHKFYGQSMYDKTSDIQDIKTALIRGILDSTYLANSPRLGFIEGQVNLDDLLDSRPGGAVRMKSANAIMPIPSVLVSEEAMQVISYIDTVKDKRTGINQAAAGLNPNILNSSATGADILNNNNQQRLELMCRIFAESGVKRLFRVIFKLVCMHQNEPQMVKLRNKWVNVNPRDWKDRMDVTATVGIGLGSKQQQASIAMQLLDVDQKIIAMQGGTDGPIVKLDNVYNKLAKLVEAVGWKTPDPYYSNPKDYTPPPPKPPSPEQQVHMQQLQSDATKAQASSDSAKASALGNIASKSLDKEIKQLDLDIKRIELAALEQLNIQDMAKRADNTSQSQVVSYGSDGQRVGV